MRRPGRRFAIALVAVAILVAAAWVAWGRTRSSAAGPTTAVVESGVVERAVSATGTLEAVVTVQVGSQVTGVVESLDADFNSTVHAGQVVARIDPATFQAQLQRAEADLVAARAQVRSSAAQVVNQKASAAAARANLAGQRAAYADAEARRDRMRGLSRQGVVSVDVLEGVESAAAQARARVDSLAAEVERSDAQIQSAEAGHEQARAGVAQSEASVAIARVNLEHTVIASPVDGVVISRSVDVGQTVAASLQAPTLFVIANDLKRMNLIAAIDEADIGVISEATATSFTVDAYPGDRFRGTIRQVRIEPKTAQNVVTYPIIIEVDNSDMRLRPGMTATVTLQVGQAKDVLRLPNAALRYWPSDVPREKMREILGAKGAPAAGPDTAPAPPLAAPDAISERARALASRLADPAITREERRELFASLRELPEEERRQVRELAGLGDREGRGPRRGGEGRGPAVSGSASDGELRFPAPPAAPPKERVVWVLGGKGKPEPRRVMTTLTDGAWTAVTAGDLAAGERVIVAAAATRDSEKRPAGGSTQSPFQPSMPGRGGR